MRINQQDAQISVIRLYFPLDAVHVSDYISPSSGATLLAVHRIWYMLVPYVWLLLGYSHTTATHMYRHIPNAMYS